MLVSIKQGKTGGESVVQKLNRKCINLLAALYFAAILNIKLHTSVLHSSVILHVYS